MADDDNELDSLTERVLNAFFEVSNTLGAGFLEKVYERALLKELCDRGIQAKTQASFPVNYKGHCVGEFFADLLIEDVLVIEIKCVDRFGNEHLAQCLNYLRASRRWVLRDEFDLTGTKYGCGEGQCGACTVLIEGAPVRSCRVPVSAVAGKEITTIEGLAPNGILHPVQEAFIEADAMQCGYCTPGMILSSVALLKKTPQPSEPEIRRALEGNVCRCGTYPRIISAVRMAAGVQHA